MQNGKEIQRAEDETKENKWNNQTEKKFMGEHLKIQQSVRIVTDNDSLWTETFR